MVDKRIELLNKIDDLLDVVDIYKPFKDTRLNNIIEWKLLVASKKVKDTYLLDMEDSSENMVRRRVKIFWLNINRSLKEESFELWEMSVLSNISSFLYYLAIDTDKSARVRFWRTWSKDYKLLTMD